MYLEFTKMHGLGNDFMVVDLITQRAIRRQVFGQQIDALAGSPSHVHGWNLVELFQDHLLLVVLSRVTCCLSSMVGNCRFV